MSDQWLYTKGGKQTGPVSGTDLRRLASTGQLSPSDQVWKEGMPNWVRVETIKGLFVAANAVPVVVAVADPGQVFAGRLAKAKKQRENVVQGAIAQGGKDAEEAFPDIVKKIERSATTGEFWCLGSDIGIDRRKWSDDLVVYYCKGYEDQIVQLLNNSGFSVEFSNKETACAMTIKW